MRRLRMGWPAAAGVCAAALTVSVAACSPVTTKAAAPFPAVFPGTATATAGTPPAQATPTHPTTAHPTTARAVRIKSDHAVGTSRGPARGYRGWVAELSAPTGAVRRVIGAGSGRLERS